MALKKEVMERLLLARDLSGLDEEQRIEYYHEMCDSLGLNPLTKPFEYIVLDERLVLYATKDCAAQLRKKHRISIAIKSREQQGDIHLVTVTATLKQINSSSERQDEAIGAVATAYYKGGQLQPITPVALANAIMKCETKAKRRVTLSICGLGMLDESEVEDVVLNHVTATDEAIAQRNMKQATANALEDKGEKPEPAGEVTKDNYKDVVSHIGKAEGQLLGRKIGELHPNVIEWLHNKWRETLTPMATEKDMRLKKAVEMAYQELKAPSQPPAAAPTGGGEVSGQPAPKQSDSTGRTDAAPKAAREWMLQTLKDRAANMILTPEQLCGYIRSSGYADIQRLEELDDVQVAYLHDEKNFQILKDIIELDVKPKESKEDAKPKPKRRRKFKPGQGELL